MTFDRLIIQNFGLFRGLHEIELTPPSGQRPIVLIGGLNGAGKTTLLDAIQLALYGPRARLSNRGALSYHDYLRRSLNRAATGVAIVELWFHHRSDGECHHYRVRRTWRVPGKTVAESIEVRVDDAIDPTLADRWDEIVEQFIPQGISHLLLFDGEQVEALADWQNSTELLRSALDSLLGLDIVEQLGHDLLALERRKRTEHRDAVDRARLDALNTEIAEQDRQLEALAATIAETEDLLKKQERAYKRFEDKFRREGGELAAAREQLEAEARRARADHTAAENVLRDLASGEAPLLLVMDLLRGVHEQSDREHEAHHEALIAHRLAERDAQRLDRLRTTFADRPTILDEIGALFAPDQTHPKPAPPATAYLHLDGDTRARLHGLTGESLPRLAAWLTDRVHHAEQCRETMDAHDARLAGAPDADAIRHLVDQRTEHQRELTALTARLHSRREDIAAIATRRAALAQEREKMLDVQIAEDFRVEDLSRLLTYAERTREVMKTFRRAVLRKRIDRIADLVLEGFQALIRKPDFITALEIDPDHLSLRLIAADGHEMSPDRLSAGERQLLAISLIWGLARASGRSLPTVIDTPLGRLDSTHRRHLVERYFPYASHQVVLLSTDEEIDRAHAQRLAPFIGHAYHLVHDPNTRSTAIQPGYFWSL